MEPDSDKELMLAVGRGRLELMGVLFDRHHERMYRFFRRTVRDREACEDLVQGLFVRMLEYRASFEGRATFLTWMYRIAIRLRSDHHDGQRLQGTPVTPDRLDEELPSTEMTVPERERSRLRAALRALRPADRELLMLTKFEGLPYQDVAELLGCSTGALKVRVHRALEQLRERYASTGERQWP
jgi:RNA polymerase sigma factor (sigma-70 family)